MSLNKDTLELILANALAAANTQINTDSATLQVVPQLATLQNLEPYKAGRDRFRGTLSTRSLPAFVGYVRDRIPVAEKLSGTAPIHDYRSAGFIDQDNMACTVIFNLGTAERAGHCDDTAALTLKPTAAFNALNQILGRSLSQQQLAEWLEDWAPNIDAFAGDAELPLAQAINGVRRMTIKASSTVDTTVGDLSASRSAMDEIEAKSQDVLPTAFYFTTVPYEGLMSATIQLRLSVITGADAPVLKLRWVGEEAQREAFADEFKGTLEAEIGDRLPLTLGTFNPLK